MAIATSLGYDDLPALVTLLLGDEKHDWSSLSTLDVLWVLYDRVLRVDPARPEDPERDRFLLSKGTDRRPTTRSSPRKASSRSSRSPALAGSTRRSVTT